jgi:hypothetical protein
VDPLDRQRFETALRACLDSGLPEGAQNIESVALLRDALERLSNDPSLVTFGSNGDYTYEDPILASAAYYYRVATTAAVGSAGPRKVSNSAIHKWAQTGIHAWLSRGNNAYVLLAGRTPKAAITLPGPTARIAVMGDAGYDSLSQHRVLQMIRLRHAASAFDLVVHLGDTYFSGSPNEVFLSLVSPLKALGIRAVSLCGNHDLYFGAEGYDGALTALEQPGRYFVVDCPNWRIACLDTALASERTLRNDGSLDPQQLAWLEQLVLKADKRTVLMSHHFIVSDWEGPAATLKLQVEELIRNRVFAWYWGHEHRMVTYRREPHGFYGSCVGNGAFLERWTEPPAAGAAEWYPRTSCSCYVADQKNWPHGFLELEMRPDCLIETYHYEGDEPRTRRLPV